MSAQIHDGDISGYVTAAYGPFELVIPSATAKYFTRAGAADTKIIGHTVNETFAADAPVTIRLFGGRTFVGIANEAIVRGDFVEVLANGRIGAGATATGFVALTAGGAAEYVEYVEVKDLIA